MNNFILAPKISIKKFLFILFLLFTNIAYGEDGKYRTILVEKSISLVDVPKHVLVNIPDQIALFLDIYFADKFPDIHRTHYFNQENDFAVVQTEVMNFFVRNYEDKLITDEDAPNHGGKRIEINVSVIDGKTNRELLESFSVTYHDHVAGREEDYALLMDDTICIIAKNIARIIGTKQWNP